jgi:hypothetical protein
VALAACAADRFHLNIPPLRADIRALDDGHDVTIELVRQRVGRPRRRATGRI